MKKILVLVMMLSCFWCKALLASIPSEYENYESVKPIEILGEDGTLILSNSPETITKKGVVYRECLVGPGRLVFHHVNATGQENQRLVITVKNLTTYEQRFEVHKEGYAKPHYHYLEAGNKLLNNYYECVTSRIFFLKPNEQMVLYDSWPFVWKNQTVLSGMLDLYASDKVEIVVAMIGNEDEVSQISKFEELDSDLAPRGTFSCLTKYEYVILPQNKNVYLLIEDEKTDWLRGVDGLTGKYAINYGNYGVLYKIKILAREDRKVFICPRGGIFQGTVRWDNGETRLIARKHVFKTIKERIYIGTIKKDEIRTLEYILPNGSAAPILLGFEINE